MFPGSAERIQREKPAVGRTTKARRITDEAIGSGRRRNMSRCCLVWRATVRRARESPCDARRIGIGEQSVAILLEGEACTDRCVGGLTESVQVRVRRRVAL